MAAGAAPENDTNDQSVNKTLSKSIKTKPHFVQSLSRTSVTFFSSENANQVAKQKFEELKEIAFKTESNDEAEEGKQKGEENKNTDDKNSENKLVSIVLNHVWNYFNIYFCFLI